MEKIIPCPFCGGNAITVNENGWKIYCLGCGIKTPDGYTKEIYVIEFWNKRTNNP